MMASKWKWLLLVISFIIFISNTEGRGGRGSSSSRGGGTGSRGGGYGSRGGGYGSSRGGYGSSRGGYGSSRGGYGSSRGGYGSGGSSSRGSSGSGPGETSSISYGSHDSNTGENSYNTNGREDSDYGSEKIDYRIRPVTPYSPPKWFQDRPTPTYTLRPIGSALSHRFPETSPDDRILNNFYDGLPKFKFDDKVLTHREIFENPEYSKEWWKADLIPTD